MRRASCWRRSSRSSRRGPHSLSMRMGLTSRLLAGSSSSSSVPSTSLVFFVVFLLALPWLFFFAAATLCNAQRTSEPLISSEGYLAFESELVGLTAAVTEWRRVKPRDGRGMVERGRMNGSFVAAHICFGWSSCGLCFISALFFSLSFFVSGNLSLSQMKLL